MQLIVTKANTLAAFSWLKQGWRLFTLQPGPFMAMSAIVFGVMIFPVLLGNNPIAAVISAFMLPYLSAGYYQAAANAEKGEVISPSDVFGYFSQFGKYIVFIRIALLSILFSIPTSHIASNIQELAMAQEVVPQSDLLLLVGLLLINTVVFLFVIPAAWIAPQTPLLTLIKQSVKACIGNAFPVIIFGILIGVIGVVSMPIVIVGWLIAYSVSVLAFYQMFLGVYRPKPADEDTNTNLDNAADTHQSESEEELTEPQEQTNSQDEKQLDQESGKDNRAE